MEGLQTVGMLTLLVVASIATNCFAGATDCGSTTATPCSEDPPVFVVELLPISADSGEQLEEAANSRSKGWSALIRSFATDPLVDELCSPLAQEHMSEDDKKDIKNLCELLLKDANDDRAAGPSEEGAPPQPQPDFRNKGSSAATSDGTDNGDQQEFKYTTPTATLLMIAVVALVCIIVTACLTCVFGKLDTTLDSPYHMSHEDSRFEAYIESKGAKVETVSCTAQDERNREDSPTEVWVRLSNWNLGGPCRNATPRSNSVRVLDLPVA
ncbi:hypothetical protein BSKO_08114 [Bryopsis sp. KO-2023]|nr:hypothetical protein BSKO_08114 [Bryopsis sp. KO-2023]